MCEAEQRARETEAEEQQRVCEIEAEEHQRSREVHDAEQQRAREDLELAAYTKNVKIRQMWDRLRVDAHMMQEKDYHERC